MSAEQELRELWKAEGVPRNRIEELIAAVNAKAAPGAMVGPFRVELTEAGEQTVIPGCEADDERTGAKQKSLF